MNNVTIIDIQKGRKNISESTSKLGWPQAWKSTSERNDNPVSRFFALLAQGKKSRREAIHAMCAHCMGCTAMEQSFPQDDWIEPGFRTQIRRCSAPSCPLWEFRPFKSSKREHQGNAA